MTRRGKRVLAALLAVILLITGLLLSVTQWLPRLAGIWLPADTTIALDGNPRLRHGALVLPGVRYYAGKCELAVVSNVALRWSGRWLASADRLQVDTACASRTESGPATGAPRTLSDWQQMLPSARVSLGQLTLLPWADWAGELRLELDPQRQQLHYQGKNITLEAELNRQQLTLHSLSLQAPGVAQPLALSGELTLPRLPGDLPQSGSLHGALRLESIPDPLRLELAWQQQRGTLRVLAGSQPAPLLTLPWQIDGQTLALQQGQWRWPYAGQPLAGGVSLSASNWRQGLAETEISGRLNLLTAGRGGRGNVVLAVGPGHLDVTDSRLPLRLTGESKLAQLQFYASLPGELRGPLTDPSLLLLPGALLRMKGRLLDTLEVDEARWPLAGVTVSSGGISGRLQAILSAHNGEFGRFRLHLDGRARGFWPDKGEWGWGYWGEGRLAPLNAKWDVSGRGRWQDRLIVLDSLSTGFDRLRYGSVTMAAPRLTLTRPLRWQRDEHHAALNGELRLKSGETRFANGGWLPPSDLTLALKGRTPADFLFQGSLKAQQIGPVRLRGRWDGDRLRGQLWWPEQSLRVFQPLLAPDLKLSIQSGTLRAQAAFSAAADQGLEAGGHWLVSNGELRLPDNELHGVDFSLPFRLADHRWYFGTRGPVALRIRQIDNQFAMENVTADLRGWYPWSADRPLQLSNVSLDLLGGQLSLASLQMPQTDAATLRLRHLDLSLLVSALKVKQIALSGHVNAALPLWLNNSQWLVKEGWVANSGPVTVRMDKTMADAISSNNIAAGAAIDWLRYMEVTRSWATLDVDNLGRLMLTAKLNGTSRFSDKDQRVELNYTQQENLFQLWRSLRFGDNLQSWVEENATLPSQKDRTE